MQLDGGRPVFIGNHSAIQKRPDVRACEGILYPLSAEALRFQIKECVQDLLRSLWPFRLVVGKRPHGGQLLFFLA